MLVRAMSRMMWRWKIMKTMSREPGPLLVTLARSVEEDKDVRDGDYREAREHTNSRALLFRWRCRESNPGPENSSQSVYRLSRCTCTAPGGPQRQGPLQGGRSSLTSGLAASA